MANIAGAIDVDASGTSRAVHRRILLWSFAATICLSAFLLFALQPLFARLVLPKLGGSPSVWAVSMCFFQAVLLAGYCYAHCLNRVLGPAQAVLAHMLVLAAACLALPVALPAAASVAPEGNTYVWLISVLAAGVGLPFFAISANAPLLQSWFGRTGHPHASDPYFLYGASNLGSLAALLLYPIVAEPLFGLSVQTTLWSAGFFALGASIIGCGVLMLTQIGTAKSANAGALERSEPKPARKQRLRWIGLSFVPSGLLVAFTTHLTTDIASAPFLWVIPLALFLATFILVFREPPLVPVRALTTAMPFVAGAVFLAMIASKVLPFWLIGGAGLCAFLCISLVCHRSLYELRPSGEHLTEFYLLMSLGGVLGGIFAAMLAPHLFTTIFEYPLLILAGIFAQPRLQWAARWRRQAVPFAAIAGCALCFLLLTDIALPYAPVLTGREVALAVAGMALFGAVVARRSPAHQAAFLVVMVLTTVLPSDTGDQKYAVRSFFGLHRVSLSENGDVHVLVHGTTVHGAQRVAQSGQPQEKRPVPMTYYHPGGGMARALALLEGDRRVGIVGLGTGAIGCYARPGDQWRMFEIDPAVVEIARNPALFTYLSTCVPGAPVIIGDARLTLGSEPAAAFDYLLIDAFSSDAIPVHLMTTEALELYVAKLRDRGLLALHISNRHLDLAPVLAANLAQLPGVTAALVRTPQPVGKMDATSSWVVLMSRDKALMERVLGWPDAKPLLPSGVAAWTDDYADVISALVRGMH